MLFIVTHSSSRLSLSLLPARTLCMSRLFPFSYRCTGFSERACVSFTMNYSISFRPLHCLPTMCVDCLSLRSSIFFRYDLRILKWEFVCCRACAPCFRTTLWMRAYTFACCLRHIWWWWCYWYEASGKQLFFSFLFSVNRSNRVSPCFHQFPYVFRYNTFSHLNPHSTTSCIMLQLTLYPFNIFHLCVGQLCFVENMLHFAKQCVSYLFSFWPWVSCELQRQRTHTHTHTHKRAHRRYWSRQMRAYLCRYTPTHGFTGPDICFIL